MKRTLIIITAIIAVIGLFMGLFQGAIQRALTLSPRDNTSQTITKTHTTTKAQAPVKTVPTPQTQPAMTATVLAQDSFQRMNQALWGTASDGTSWNGDANSQQQQNAFSIIGKAGVITNTQGTLNALLGPTLPNAEVLVSGSINRFGGTANFGAVLRWTDKNHWYKAYIDGKSLVIVKRLNAVSTILTMLPFPAQNNTLYSIRFRAVGTNLLAKAWVATNAEPTNWQVNATDAALTTGQGGVRVLILSNDVITITSFTEIAVNNGM